MTVSLDFSYLNTLRPRDARFGEVVSIALYQPNRFFVANELPDPDIGTLIGVSKRKSIHVPASSNAYWNFVNLRADLIEWFSEKGTCREDRNDLTRLLNLAVRRIHLHEVESTYQLGDGSLFSYQYYNAYFGCDVFGGFVSVWNAPMSIDETHKHLFLIR